MGYNPRFADNYATVASVTIASTGGTLAIYDGFQPSSPAMPVTTQRLLAELTVPGFATSVVTGEQASATADPITPVTAALTGNPTWFRVVTADGVPVFDGEIGAADSDLTLIPDLIVAGVPVTITSFTITGTGSQQVTGVGTVAIPPPGTIVPVSGYGGTEPAFPGALSWCGYLWEKQNWGTANGQPAAANVTVDANGYLNLRAVYAGTSLTGGEIDSVRGDRGVTGNPSTWGYGTYQWVIGTDLTTIDPSLVLGLFTFWAYGTPASAPPNQYGKGGPYGQKEIDMEMSSWSPEGSRTATLYQMGFYQDDGHGVTVGVPATYGQSCHTMTEGSQVPVPAGHPVTTLQFVWLPQSITWNIWYGTDTTTAPDQTLTMTEGQTYSYTEPAGGNQFTGTVHIPATGGQQVIMNLWSQNQNMDIADTTVVIRSFTYTPSS